jgi:1-acyl-sn-glycerol-3-phosphate acyltransferase
MEKRERELTTINAGDILASLGLPGSGPLRRHLEILFRHPARVFARQVLAFDEEVQARGMREAAAGLLKEYAPRLRVAGQGRIPRTGPLLILSNHPGMTDTLALFSSIPRDDLAVLSADRPFLRTLTAVSRSLIAVPEEPSARSATIRRALRHLASGGALLTFPAGTTEPDPSVHRGAREALVGWSPSTALFTRIVPDCIVVPAVVRGVLSPWAQHSPLTLLRRAPQDRQFLGVMLQIMAKVFFPRLLPVKARLDYLAPLSGRELASLGPAGAARRIRETVEDFLNALSAQPERAWASRTWIASEGRPASSA